MLADCLHDLAALGTDGLIALVSALFLAGLAGGATHCAGMCAPFVLAQVAASAPLHAGGGTLRRLSGAALLPYHLGRGIGYAALGGLAGGLAGAIARSTSLRWALAALLVAAALAMATQAAERLGRHVPRLPRLPALPSGLFRPVQGLLADPAGLRGVWLGVLLSGLPCGLLYGALAAASASGSVLGGAIGMAAFVLGTVPALVAVGVAGRLFGRRRGPRMEALAGLLFALNAVVLAAIAARTAFA